MSYWRYSSWLFGGDPYFSPNVSSSIPDKPVHVASLFDLTLEAVA